MKLSTKILLLISPAIMISTALSSYIIFSIQKDALIKREHSYLQLRMEKLTSHFQRSASFLNSFSYSLTKNHVIEDYFNDHDNPYRELELIDTLQESVNELQNGNLTFVNLSLFDGHQDLLYYAESSNDPFAEMDSALIANFKATLANTTRFSHSYFTYNSFGEGMLMRYDMLDKRTGKKPLRFDPNNVFFVVVSVSLNPFNNLRRQIEFDTQSSIVFSKQPLTIESERGAFSVQLTDNHYATIDPATFLIESKINDVWHQIAFSFSVAGLITISVILMILYRHVIFPITKLEKQLRDVENKERDNIEKLDSSDEVASLSVRLYDMYEELDNTYQKTKQLAERDSLTDLVNRRQFHAQSSNTLKHLPQDTSAWVVYIDLDNFKFVNDKYGHQEGDQLLVEFADYLKLTSRPSSKHEQSNTIVSRLSGDEFAMLITAPKSLGNLAQQRVEKLLSHTDQDQYALSNGSPVTVSVGIASYPENGHDINKLLSCADAAMYQAKSQGKNRYAYYSEQLNQQVLRRANIEQALREASLDEEMSLLFQPYINSDNKKVVGVEALLRWHSPTLGPVWPDEFIPIAEHRGLFGHIDRCVIRKAFAHYRKLEEALGEGVKLSINLSSAELNTDELADYIEEFRALYSLSPEVIEFEITETFSNEDAEFPLLHKLSDLGYLLAIDDFGSGFTSLTQLVQYPVQKIKFDRLFLNSLIETNSKHVLKPLIELCHSQKQLVTAEGIEDLEMQQWLTGYHCDLLQGYFYAKPMPLKELKQWNQSFGQEAA
ncbi:EAL domain-containing protein [Vibrio aquaticus]|uniref:EAL domain-containing protein n=1 Tax=Vibrio aquaticus TaxID=2496559 RepID=A0A432D2M3_9VIBR|nr:EAL domain-containing protein [Vibrio aquaticus]RTZ18204.1 EAL domain-containing protein [Vibrio aquaticus]